MALEAKFHQLRSPHDPTTINEFGCLKIAATTTVVRQILPPTWAGRYVWVHNTSATASEVIEFAFSKRATAEVDTSVSAGAGSTTVQAPSAKVGMTLHGSQKERVLMPMWEANESGYFIVDASASVTVKLYLGDGP